MMARPRPSRRVLLQVSCIAVVAGCGADATPPPDPALIVLSVGTLEFNAVLGGPGVEPRVVAITNGGGGQLSDVASTVSYASDQPAGWLSLSQNGTTAPLDLTVTASLDGLAAGTYQAVISVAAPAGSNTPRSIDVVLTVDPAPALVLSAGLVEFTAMAAGADPEPQAVTITNAGGGALAELSAAVSYASGQPTGWLAAALSGTSDPASLTLSPAVGSLSAGSYEATVSVNAPGASNTPQTLGVTFVIEAQPAIALDPADVVFSAVFGGGPPDAQAVSVTNAGGGELSQLEVSLSYESGGASGWLTVALSGSTAPATLTLTPSIESIEPGTHHASVTISAPEAANTPQNLVASLAVAEQQVISLSASSAEFGAAAGGEDPPVQTVSVGNGGGGELAGLEVAVTYAGGQATGWLEATLGTSSAPTELRLAASTGSLPAGTYEATISVSADVAANSPQTLPVTFTVEEPPVIALSAATAEFVGASGAEPGPVSIAIANDGGWELTGLEANVSYAAGQPTGWLAVELSGTVAPSTLTLTASAGSLTPGTYDATVAISSPGATNTPQTVGVTFTVLRAPASYLGTYALEPTDTITCTSEIGTFTFPFATMEIFGASLDHLDFDVSTDVGLEMPVLLEPYLQEFSGEAVIEKVDTAGAIAYSTWTIAMSGGFTDDTTYAVRLDATLQLEILYLGVLWRATCTELSADMIGRRL